MIVDQAALDRLRAAALSCEETARQRQEVPTLVVQPATILALLDRLAEAEKENLSLTTVADDADTYKCGHARQSDHDSQVCYICNQRRQAESIAALRSRCEKLEALAGDRGDRLEEWEEERMHILTEECSPDEKHCTCVPVLRQRAEQAERERDEALRKLNAD